MAALVCEICGGKLIGKAGGVFVCDSCGMEYSKEWAQEKIQEINGTVKIEGKVDVTGSTVKIDKEQEIKNLLIIARRSFENGQYKLAAQQYNNILKNDPNNAEAAFFSVFSDSIDCKVGEITCSANVIKNSMDNCTKLVNQINNIKDKEKLLEQIVDYTIVADKTFCDSANRYMNNCGRTSQSMYNCIQMQGASGEMITELAECIVNNIDYSKNIYNLVIKCYTYRLSIVEKKYKPKYDEKIKELKKIISLNENKEFEKKTEEEKKKLKYNEAEKMMNMDDIYYLEEALEIFREIDVCEDSNLKIQECIKKLEKLKSIKYNENKEKYENFCNNYNDFFDTSKSLKEKNLIGNIHGVKPVQAIFSELNYKDSEQIAEDMRNKINNINSISKEVSEKVSKYSKTIYIIWVSFSLVVGVVTWCLSGFGPAQFIAYGGIPTLLILIPVVLKLIKKQEEKIFLETIKKYQN